MKKIVLGRGTLSFGGKSYPVTAFEIDQPSTDVEKVCGYDPQMLLEDKRGYYQRWADSHREITYSEACRVRDNFRDEFPALKSFWDTNLGEPYDPAKHYAKGGEFTPTGRWRSEPEMQRLPLLFPGEEIRVTKPAAERKSFEHVDFGKMEARVLAHHMVVPERMMRRREPSFAKPIFTLTLHGTEKFRAAMQRASEAAREATEKMLLLALYGGTPWTRPRTPDEKRGRRILDLMGSSDPRQRKRGNRLFRQWMRSRPGINWSN